MTSLETSATRHPDRTRAEPHSPSDERDPARDTLRKTANRRIEHSSPDPMSGTDRYRLVTPYTIRV